MAATDPVLDLLRRQREATLQPDADPARRKQYIAALTDLLGKIKSWLQPAQKEGLLKLAERSYKLQDRRGGYSAPGLEIRALVGPSVLVELEPKGWELIGALGRVDLVSGTSYFKLILESSAQWQMEHVSPAGLRLHVPVREDHFKEWLAKLMA